MAGTGTDVGKTWVAARVLRTLRGGGHSVAARKPAQSYGAGTSPEATDAAVLAAASGEQPTEVCPPWRWYEVAMAPPMAADVLGRPPFTLADLAHELRWPEEVGVGVVETAGGVRSPLATDGDTVDLIGLLDPDLVLLVADAGLGTINAVRCSVGALPSPPCVVLNRFDPSQDLHRRNLQWLCNDGLDAVAVPADVDGVVQRVLGGQFRATPFV
jgi:dethiobiotin synthetase